MLTKTHTGGYCMPFLDELQEPFGRRIKYFRQQRGFSQEKLAELSHITPRYLIYIEQGTHSPSFQVFYQLATALGVPFSDLLTFSDELV